MKEKYLINARIIDPKNDLDEVIDYLDMNKFDFEENINKHRNTEVWSQNNNSWKLNFQIK